MLHADIGVLVCCPNPYPKIKPNYTLMTFCNFLKHSIVYRVSPQAFGFASPVVQLLLSPTAPVGLPLPHPEAPLLPVWTPARAAPEAGTAAGALPKARLGSPATYRCSVPRHPWLRRGNTCWSPHHVWHRIAHSVMFCVRPGLPVCSCTPATVTGECVRGLPARLQ